MKQVLITRPEPGLHATAAALAARGFTPVLCPCLTIERRALRMAKWPAAIIVTSGQAVPALPAAWHNIPVFCVGDATGERLRSAGFAQIFSANGDAADLYKLVTATRLPGPHVMVVGARHGLRLQRDLAAAGIPLVRRTVYAARPVRALTSEAQAALQAGEIETALFYSAETVRAFRRALKKPPETAAVTAFALSAAVAEPLTGLPWRKIRVAVAPTEAGMMALFDHE